MWPLSSAMGLFGGGGGGSLPPIGGGGPSSAKSDASQANGPVTFGAVNYGTPASSSWLMLAIGAVALLAFVFYGRK